MFTVVLGVLALEGLTLVLWHLDRSRMLNAVIARSPQEFQKLEGKVKALTPTPHLVDPFEVPFGI